MQQPSIYTPQPLEFIFSEAVRVVFLKHNFPLKALQLLPFWLKVKIRLYHTLPLVILTYSSLPSSCCFSHSDLALPWSHQVPDVESLTDCCLYQESFACVSPWLSPSPSSMGSIYPNHCVTHHCHPLPGSAFSLCQSNYGIVTYYM